jgi:Protein of unknown function (DUF3071)
MAGTPHARASFPVTTPETSGSAELPVGQRVARMLREIQEGRRTRRNGDGSPPRFRTDASEPPLVRLLPPERPLQEVARSAGAVSPEAHAPTVPQPEGRLSKRRARPSSGSSGIRGAGRPNGGDRVVRSANGGRLAPSLASRTERPTIPEGSRLTAAEIQAQIRAGRGVRAVAEMAEAPVDWVRYLAEPVMAEKAAVLRQVLTARPQRPRAKGPGDPLGRALLLALRARKVPSPEHVLANGFTAYRRGHGPWRVRLAFRKDGRRYSALWAFDPRTNRIEPRNGLADELGWRRVSPPR